MKKNSECKYSKKKIAGYIILILFILFVLFIAVKYGRNFKHIRLHRLKNYIQSYGKFSAVAFIIIYTFKPILFVIPSSIMSIVAGSIYGPYIATLLSMIGCFGSATVAFFIAKLLGKSFVDKIIRGKGIKLDENIGKYGFKIMLLMRLSFVFPYDGLSFAAGLSKMKYKDFILGTILGIFPEMMVYSFMGKNIGHPFSLKFVLPIIFLIFIIMGAMSLKNRIKNIQ